MLNPHIRTFSFKKPTVRVTSEFFGLDETLASSGKSPITMTPVRSYSEEQWIDMFTVK